MATPHQHELENARLEWTKNKLNLHRDLLAWENVGRQWVSVDFKRIRVKGGGTIALTNMFERDDSGCRNSDRLLPDASFCRGVE
jgi:hypothetical protein